MNECLKCNEKLNNSEIYLDSMGDMYCEEHLPTCQYCDENEDSCGCNSDNTERFT